MASIEPFFIPPLSPVKSIRISLCISTCRSQYLLPSTIVFQSGKYYIFTHFVCVLLHKLYFWMQIVWFVENNSGECSNAIWDNARDCWEGLWSRCLPNMLTISSSIFNVVGSTYKWIWIEQWTSLKISQQVDWGYGEIKLRKWLVSFKQLGPGRPSVGGPRMDCRAVTGPEVEKSHAALFACGAQLGGDLIQQQCWSNFWWKNT